MKTLKIALPMLIVFIIANLLCPPFEPPVERQVNITLPKFRQQISNNKTFIIGSEKDIAAIPKSIITDFSKGGTALKIKARKGGSAWTYAVIKNALPENCRVLIPYRSWQLTYPELFAESARDEINFFARKHEPDIDRLAYLKQMPKSEYWLRRLLPMYAHRKKITTFIDNIIGSQIFDEYIRQEAFTNSTSNEKNLPLQPGNNNFLWNFDHNINKSLLPLIIKICRAKMITPTFIDVTRKHFNTQTANTLEVQYRDQMRGFMRQNQIRHIGLQQ